MEKREEQFADPERNVLEMGIRPGYKVADFGAGSGAYTLALAPLVGEEGRVYAIEIQKDVLSKIRSDAHAKGFAQVEVIWGDIDRPGGSRLADASVNVVLFSNILFQLEDRAAALREARRVLKAGGTLVIIDWQESFGGMGPRPEDVVSDEKARMLATRSGFELIREFGAGAHHYGLVFRLPAAVPGAQEATAATLLESQPVTAQ
jgi:ubiquinone/menaquinone biosynthesis C-methylase UbiE